MDLVVYRLFFMFLLAYSFLLFLFNIIEWLVIN